MKNGLNRFGRISRWFVAVIFGVICQAALPMGLNGSNWTSGLGNGSVPSGDPGADCASHGGTIGNIQFDSYGNVSQEQCGNGNPWQPLWGYVRLSSCQAGYQNVAPNQCQKICPANQINFPADSDQCVVPPTCTAGTTYVPGANQCRPTQCPTGQSINPQTGQCEAPPPPGSSSSSSGSTSSSSGGTDGSSSSSPGGSSSSPGSTSSGTPQPTSTSGSSSGGGGSSTSGSSGSDSSSTTTTTTSSSSSGSSGSSSSSSNPAPPSCPSGSTSDGSGGCTWNQQPPGWGSSGSSTTTTTTTSGSSSTSSSGASSSSSPTTSSAPTTSSSPSTSSAPTSSSKPTTSSNPSSSSNPVTTTTTTTTSSSSPATSSSPSGSSGAPSGSPGSQDLCGTSPELCKDVCDKHPELNICNNSTVSGSCAATACTGDAITCQILKTQQLRDCQDHDDTDPNVILGKQLLAGQDPKASTLPTLDNASTVDLSGTQLDSSGWGGGGQCFQDKQFSAMGQTITIPLSKLCDYLIVFRALIMLIAALSSFKMVSGVILNS